MVLKTFLNLPKERQKEIFLVCLEEFAYNDYESASLSRIIKKLGLAKGSFYRYFESKKDLYIYLVEECRKINAEELTQGYYEEGSDFFSSLMEGFVTLLKTERKYPNYLVFSFKVSGDHRHDILGSLADKWKKERSGTIYRIISLHQEKGNLRKDIAADKIAQCVNYMILGIRQYFFGKYFPEKPDNIEKIHDLPDSVIRAEMMDFIKIMKRGIVHD